MPLRIHLLTCALALAVAPPLPAVPGLPPIRVEADTFHASEADILAVCRSAAGEILRHFPEAPELEPILIRRGGESPVVAYRRTATGEVLVLLNTGDSYWSQYAYQFAHEFCHILCRFHQGNRHLWFEEVLCETASLFAIRAMARAWKDQPPYPNWAGYRDSLRAYTDEIMGKRPLLATLHRDGLAAYFRQHREHLAAHPTDRETNGSIAVLLLPLFERQPAAWEALRYLPVGPQGEGDRFEDHLQRWHRAAPARHRPFIAEVAGLFGVTFKNPDPNP